MGLFSRFFKKLIMKLFKEVSYTIDEKIVGKNGSPFTIEIQSKEFHDYKLQNNKDIFLNLNNFKTGNDFANMPDNLKGKLLRRKNSIDIMDYSPNFLGLHIIVSEKVKQIVEELQIDSKEYYFRKIRIKDTNDDCYLLLVPIIDYDELLFEKSIYRKVTHNVVSTKTYSCNDERLIKKLIENSIIGLDIHSSNEVITTRWV